MNLSHEDTDLFFKLMWELQFYVNSRLNLISGLNTAQAYSQLTQSDKLMVRNALYEHIDLLNDFVAKNPANFSEDELRLVQDWTRFIQRKFYIYRFLKNYTIFISADASDEVYGVLGLYDSIEDIFFGRPLPVLVQAVLLPFKGKIIYDGLMSGYPVFFGSGIKGDLKETYMRAKQNGRIIETIGVPSPILNKEKSQKITPDLRPALDKIVKDADKLRQAENVLQSKAYGLLKTSAYLAQATAHDPNNLDEFFKLAKKVDRALNQFLTTLERAE